MARLSDNGGCKAYLKLRGNVIKCKKMADSAYWRGFLILIGTFLGVFLQDLSSTKSAVRKVPKMSVLVRFINFYLI